MIAVNHSWYPMSVRCSNAAASHSQAGYGTKERTSDDSSTAILSKAFGNGSE